MSDYQPETRSPHDELASQVEVMTTAFELDPLVCLYSDGQDREVRQAIDGMAETDAKRLLGFAIGVISVTLPAWSQLQDEK